MQKQPHSYSRNPRQDTDYWKHSGNGQGLRGMERTEIACCLGIRAAVVIMWWIANSRNESMSGADGLKTKLANLERRLIRE